MNKTLEIQRIESKPQKHSRKLLHRRTIIAEGFEREDGLWELVAQLIDSKSRDFPNSYLGAKTGGILLAGEPLHGIALRVVIDINLIIKEVEVQMPYTPYALCKNIIDTYQKAVGLKIESGFLRKINKLFRSVNGCAHVTELWSTIGTLAYQTMFPEFTKRNFNSAVEGLAGACHVHTTVNKTKENIRVHIPPINSEP